MQEHETNENKHSGHHYQLLKSRILVLCCNIQIASGFTVADMVIMVTLVCLQE